MRFKFCSFAGLRLSCTFLFTALLQASAAWGAGLNDTGITFCGDASTNTANCATVAKDGGTYPRQDARYGRDTQAAAGALSKTGGGGKGFDFTKIANNGSTLSASATLGSGSTDWACTRDNVTGLIWEVNLPLTQVTRRAHFFSSNYFVTC